MWGFKGRKDPGAIGNVRHRGNVLFYHTDHLGENIIKNRYLAFVRPRRACSAPMGNSGSRGCPVEEKIGKYYARSRFYDYRIGRFLIADFNRGGILNPDTLNNTSMR